MAAGVGSGRMMCVCVWAGRRRRSAGVRINVEGEGAGAGSTACSAQDERDAANGKDPFCNVALSVSVSRYLTVHGSNGSSLR